MDHGMVHPPVGSRLVGTPLNFNMVHLQSIPSLEKEILLETIIFRFHVKLWGGTLVDSVILLRIVGPQNSK